MDRPGPIHDRPRPGTEARDPAGERVAGVRIAAAIAGLEPPLPLRRGPVRPRLAIHLALDLALDPVVADGGGRVERLRDSSSLTDVGTRLDGVGEPDAGEQSA